MTRSKTFSTIGFAGLIALMLLVGGVVLAQGGVLDAIDTLLTQAENSLDADDLVTAQALFVGANAAISDDVIVSCPALAGAQAILTQASTTGDIATARAFMTSVRTLLDTCSPGNDSPAPDAGTTQDQSQEDQQEEDGDAQTAQSFQQGSPGATAVPAMQEIPTNLAVITADNVHRLEALYQVGDGTINQMELSPDGQTIALSGAKGVWLLDAHNLHVEPILIPTETTVGALAWSPDNNQLAMSLHMQDHVIHIIDVASHNVLATLAGHTGRISDLAWSPNGQWLVSTGTNDGTTRMWNALSGSIHTIIESQDEARVNAVCWSPDSQQFATASSDNHTHIYDGQSGALLVSLDQTEEVRDVDWSPDGSQLLSVSYTMIRIWDATTHRLQATLEAPQDEYQQYFRLYQALWSPNGQFIAARSPTGRYGAEIYIYDVQSGTMANQFETNRADEDLAWQADNQLLAMSEWHILQINTATSQINSTLYFDAVSIASKSWSPDGMQIALGMQHRDIHIIDAVTGNLQRVITIPTEGAITGLAWSPDGRYIASTTFSYAREALPAYVWDAASGVLVTTLPAEPYGPPLWSPSGNFLGIYNRGNRFFTLWDTTTWQTVGEAFYLYTDPVFYDEQTLAVQKADGVQLVDVTSGETTWIDLSDIPENSYPTSSHSPDRQWLAVGVQASILLYRNTGGVANPAYAYVHTYPVRSSSPGIGWSPDSQILVTGEYNPLTLTFFSTGSTAPIANIPEIGGAYPTFSPDGQRIAISDDGGVRIYGISQ